MQVEVRAPKNATLFYKQLSVRTSHCHVSAFESWACVCQHSSSQTRHNQNVASNYALPTHDRPPTRCIEHECASVSANFRRPGEPLTQNLPHPASTNRHG